MLAPTKTLTLFQRIITKKTNLTLFYYTLFEEESKGKLLQL